MSATTSLGETMSHVSVFLNSVDILLSKATSYKKKSEALNKFIKSCKAQNLSQADQSLGAVIKNIALHDVMKAYVE